MKKVALGVAGVGVAGFAAWLALSVTRSSADSTGTATPAKPASAAATTAAPALPSEAPQPAASKIEPSTQAPADVKQFTAIYQRAITAAVPCYRDRPASQRAQVPVGHPDETTQELRVEYKIEVVAGVAHVRGVKQLEIEHDANEPFDPNLLDGKLADCVLDKLEKLSWSTTQPDGALTVIETFPVGELDRTITTERPPKPPAPKDPKAIPAIGTVPR